MNITFRWAIGQNTYWEDSSSLKLLVAYIELAIGSAQQIFHDAHFVLLCNSTDGNLSSLVHNLLVAIPDPICDIHKIDIIEQIGRFKSPFHFDPPPSVWWKWIPLELGKSDIEIIVDIDGIFCDPVCPNLLNWITSADTLLIQQETSFVPRDNFLRSASLLKKACVGFVGLKKNTPFRQAFVSTSKLIRWGKVPDYDFFREQKNANKALGLLYEHGYRYFKIADYSVLSFFYYGLGDESEWIHFASSPGKYILAAGYSMFKSYIRQLSNSTLVDKRILVYAIDRCQQKNSVYLTTQSIESLVLLMKDSIKNIIVNACLIFNAKMQDWMPYDILFEYQSILDIVPHNAVLVERRYNHSTIEAIYKTDSIYHIIWPLRRIHIETDGHFLYGYAEQDIDQPVILKDGQVHIRPLATQVNSEL